MCGWRCARETVVCSSAETVRLPRLEPKGIPFLSQASEERSAETLGCLGPRPPPSTTRGMEEDSYKPSEYEVVVIGK